MLRRKPHCRGLEGVVEEEVVLNILDLSIRLTLKKYWTMGSTGYRAFRDVNASTFAACILTACFVSKCLLATMKLFKEGLEAVECDIENNAWYDHSTLRKEEYKDRALAKLGKHFGMAKYDMTLPNNLKFPVLPGGSNMCLLIAPKTYVHRVR